MGEEITVTIKGDGTVRLDCDGFIGEACNITKAAEEALGLISREDKGDIFLNELNEFQTDTGV